MITYEILKKERITFLKDSNPDVPIDLLEDLFLFTLEEWMLNLYYSEEEEALLHLTLIIYNNPSYPIDNEIFKTLLEKYLS